MLATDTVDVFALYLHANTSSSYYVGERGGSEGGREGGWVCVCVVGSECRSDKGKGMREEEVMITLARCTES